MGQGPMALAGVSGAAPPIGSPEGKALWWGAGQRPAEGSRANGPCGGVGAEPPTGVQGQSPCWVSKGQSPLVRGNAPQGVQGA